MVSSAEDVLGYGLYAIAYGTSLLAFLMTRINWLRALFVLSSGCYALYYYIFPAEPLWLDVISEGAFVLVNLVMLSYVLWSSKRIKLTQPENYLYRHCFGELDKHEFKKILSIGRWQVTAPGAELIRRDHQCEYLYFLLSGEVEINDGEDTIATRRTGSVLGELSYRLESTATANVQVTETCMLLALPQQKLRKLCHSNERIGNAIAALLSAHMASRLAEDRR